MRYVVSILSIAAAALLATYFWKADDFAGTRPPQHEAATPEPGGGDSGPAETRLPDETPKEPRGRRQVQQPGGSDATQPIPSSPDVAVREGHRRAQRHPTTGVATTPAVSVADAINQWLNDPGDPVMGNPNTAPHQVFQGEHADDQWSAAATDQLRKYLEEGLGARFEFPELECRQDLCEIQAATADHASNEDATDFQQVVNSMPQQPWWQTLGFGGPTISLKSGPDGRLLLICFITRNST